MRKLITALVRSISGPGRTKVEAETDGPFGPFDPNALIYMPGCPSNTKVHELLNWLKRTIKDAEAIRSGSDPRRLSERVMDQLAREQEHQI